MNKNTIQIQDELIEKLKRYDPKGRNYYALKTRAVKKARRQLIYLGFENHLDQMIQDCYDIVKLAPVADDAR